MLHPYLQHKEAGLIIVCAAEEFLDILNAYPPQKKVHEEIDAWGDTNNTNSRCTNLYKERSLC